MTQDDKGTPRKMITVIVRDLGETTAWSEGPGNGPKNKQTRRRGDGRRA